jgi:hypothetical protein
MARTVSVLCVSLCVCSPLSAETRMWTDATGRHSIQAAYRGHDDRGVRLEVVGKQEVTVPLEKLSLTDRQYLKEVTQRYSAYITGLVELTELDATLLKSELPERLQSVEASRRFFEPKVVVVPSKDIACSYFVQLGKGARRVDSYTTAAECKLLEHQTALAAAAADVKEHREDAKHTAGFEAAMHQRNAALLLSGRGRLMRVGPGGSHEATPWEYQAFLSNAVGNARRLQRTGKSAGYDETKSRLTAAAAQARGQLEKTKGELEQLRELRELLAAELKRLEAPVFEEAMVAMQSRQSDRRTAALEIVGYGGTSRELHLIDLGLTDEDETVQDAARRALRRTGLTAASKEIARYLKHNNPDVRVIAVEALQADATRWRLSLGSLAQAIKDEDARVRNSAYSALEAIVPSPGWKDRPTVSRLLSVFHSADETVVFDALAFFKKKAVPQDYLLGSYRLLKRHASPAVREAAKRQRGEG